MPALDAVNGFRAEIGWSDWVGRLSLFSVHICPCTSMSPCLAVRLNLLCLFVFLSLPASPLICSLSGSIFLSPPLFILLCHSQSISLALFCSDVAFCFALTHPLPQVGWSGDNTPGDNLHAFYPTKSQVKCRPSPPSLVECRSIKL